MKSYRTKTKILLPFFIALAFFSHSCEEYSELYVPLPYVIENPTDNLKVAVVAMERPPIKIQKTKNRTFLSN